MGGDWHDLGGALSDDASEPVALQPLARIDDAAERAWAAEWIANILALRGDPPKDLNLPPGDLSHATDLIAEASLAFELDATPWEIGGATHAHPTLSEVIGEAAMAVDGQSLNF